MRIKWSIKLAADVKNATAFRREQSMMLRILAQVMRDESANRYDAFSYICNMFRRLAGEMRAQPSACKCRQYFRVHDHAHVIKDVIIYKADESTVVYPFVALDGGVVLGNCGLHDLIKETALRFGRNRLISIR